MYKNSKLTYDHTNDTTQLAQTLWSSVAKDLDKIVWGLTVGMLNVGAEG